MWAASPPDPYRWTRGSYFDGRTPQQAVVDVTGLVQHQQDLVAVVNEGARFVDDGVAIGVQLAVNQPAEDVIGVAVMSRLRDTPMSISSGHDRRIHRSTSNSIAVSSGVVDRVFAART